MSAKDMPWISSGEEPIPQFCGGDGECGGSCGSGGSECDGDCNGGGK